MYNPKTIKGINHRDLESLHPIVAAKAKVFLEKANALAMTKGMTVKPISTLRTWDEQRALYAISRTVPGKKVTNANAGSSMHNWGLALDIGVFVGGKYIHNKDTEAMYKALGAIGKQCGFTWGGDFKSMLDMPHYEFTGKYAGTTAINLLLKGMSVDELLGVKNV